MIAASALALLALFVAPARSAPQAQVPLSAPAAARALRGRFLHLTDMHPDPFYAAGVPTHLHRKKEKVPHEHSACHPKVRAPGTFEGQEAYKYSGPWGTPASGCDSPLGLVNATLSHVGAGWADSVDFVVWTGDSARHDNDPQRPRTLDEITGLNRFVAGRMKEEFWTNGVSVIPNLGNNDVHPHNIMEPGPNNITRQYLDIWKHFIPTASRKTFEIGGYYSVEVVPGELAVISLNTLYFFESNTAVRGCPSHDNSDPGNLEFKWLEALLLNYRARGMFAYLIGHVPPSPQEYYPECYDRYSTLAIRFQGTILGHLYGHMNVDHFFFVQAPTAVRHRGKRQPPLSHSDLYTSLLQEFGTIEAPEDTDEGVYAVINVNPSVVPNPYVPAYRAYAYNISARSSPESAAVALDPAQAPSRTNRLWTPLGFAQFYAPGIRRVRADEQPMFQLEYTTFARERLLGCSGGECPIPRERLPQASLRATSTITPRRAPYGMPDLTVGSWLALARRLGDSEEKTLRDLFGSFMRVSEAPV